ncbi:MAG: globin domain-containing protein [Shimia sp.]
MNENDIKLVARSYGRVFPLRQHLARHFYDRLFAAHPAVRSLFPEDMSGQHAKFAAMLHNIVTQLSNLDAIIPDIQALGQRHADYGATPAHYDAVGETLLGALEDICPAGLSAEERAAWCAAYGVLSGAMQSAARQAA